MTDALKRKVPGWKTKSQGNPLASIAELEVKAERGAQVNAVMAHAGWAVVKDYLTGRKEQIQAVLEGAVLTQDKALELAQTQGRIRELKLFEEYMEVQKKRGLDAAREIAERKGN